MLARVHGPYSYAALAGKPISNNNALNMLMVVIAHTGLFAIAYKEWHGHDDDQKTLFNTFIFWAEKVRLMKTCDNLAGNMGAATRTAWRQASRPRQLRRTSSRTTPSQCSYPHISNTYDIAQTATTTATSAQPSRTTGIVREQQQ